MNIERATPELFAALAKAQAEIENASKNAANPHFRSRYADLAERLEREAASTTANHGTAYRGIIVTGLGDCRGPLDDPCCPWGV